MKSILIIATVLLSLIACKKSRVIPADEMGDPPVYFGESSLKLNGVARLNFLPLSHLNYAGKINENYELSIGYSDSHNFAREAINFANFKFKDSIYNFKTSNGTAPDGTFSIPRSSFTLLGGDVIIGIYDVDSTKPCVLNITRVDSTTRELWGTFYGTYIYPNNATPPNNYPRVINITEGSFHTKVLW